MGIETRHTSHRVAQIKAVSKLINMIMDGDTVLGTSDAIESLLLHYLLPNLNLNIIVLIPKVKGAMSMSDFRPITLSNFQFKIITKILAEKLASITSWIISPNQRGFIRDIHISECVALAFEAINTLDKKQFGGNMALKIDISKAFDTLDWNFLLLFLRQFGFSFVFCEWIFVILHSA